MELQRYNILRYLTIGKQKHKYEEKCMYLKKLLNNLDYKKMLNSPYFDAQFYIKNNPDVKSAKMYPLEHYMKYGYKEGRNPSSKYDFKLYANTYFDLQQKDINPVLHYIRHGKAEGRCLQLIPNYGKKQIRKKKYVIYTCITGGYEVIPAYSYYDNCFNYVLFTDNEILLQKKSVGIWKIKPLQYEKLDNIRNARWHKTHPHILFPDYQYSIWIDANVIPRSSFLFKKIKKCIKRQNLLTVPPHPERNDCYQEAEFLIKNHYDLPKLIKEEINIIRRDAYPSGMGLQETNIIVSQHNNNNIIQLNEKWWNFIAKYSRRDQICFNYLCWKYNIPLKNLGKIQDIRCNPTHINMLPHALRKEGVKECKTISIIIPIHNALSETIDMISSIEKSKLSENVDILMINDKSDTETTEYLRSISKQNSKYKLLENLKNMQFVRTCNKGLSCAKGDILVLLNNDTMIPPRWEERILDCFNSDGGIGVASPIASGSGLWNLPILSEMNFEEMDRHVEKVSKKNYPIVLCPEGFCFAIRRECFNEIGFLDEIYCPIYCEETDYALRALKAGWKTVIIDNLYMYHKRHASVGSKFRSQQIEKNWKILMSRHSALWNIRETKYMTTAKLQKIKEIIQRG